MHFLVINSAIRKISETSHKQGGHYTRICQASQPFSVQRLRAIMKGFYLREQAEHGVVQK
jgi:hypothetical protein